MQKARVVLTEALEYLPPVPGQNDDVDREELKKKKLIQSEQADRYVEHTIICSRNLTSSRFPHCFSVFKKL
jgi:hypothetical protein